MYYVSVVFTMTERADQLHHDNAPAHSAALVQAFLGKASHHPGLSAPLYSPDLAPCDSWLFPELKLPSKGRRRKKNLLPFNGDFSFGKKSEIVEKQIWAVAG